jgi:hypothetical protein
MTSTSVLTESTRTEPEIRVSAPRGLSLGLGIMGIVGAAAFWIVSLVLFHNLMTRLLH